MTPPLPPLPHLRLARPVANPSRSLAMYAAGLGLERIGGFENHEGFDGTMAGLPGAAWHLEFTRCRHHAVAPAPTEEDLLVLYLPEAEAWEAGCARMLAAGFAEVKSFNPYWDRCGRTFQDADGYRTVLARAAWR